MTTERVIDDLCDGFVDDYAALDPIIATYLGISGHDHQLTDLSPDGFAAREEFAEAAFTAVDSATPVDAREAVARDAFIERVGLQIELADAGYSRSDFSVISSGLHHLRSIFDLMPTATEEDWSNISSRMAGVPAALQGYRITLAEEANKGRVSAARQYSEVASQIRNWTGQEGETGDLFAKLVGSSEVDGALRADLDRNAAAASRAIADFGMFLEDEMEPRGRTNEACGREQYALASREFLGATVDLEQTYAWGWEELKRLADDMTATAGRIVPGASLPEAIAALDADPSRNITGKDAFRGWMQELAERTIEEMDGVHFDIPDEIRRIECCLAPTNDGGIYYTGPSEDFTRPGRMWWAVPDGIDRFSPWREVTTVYHEGVPGHHLQVGQTAVRADVLNRWQRLMCWVSGHGEGWALYAERLMDDLGYLSDPGRPSRHAGRSVLPGRPRHRGHRHAPRVGDPQGQPLRLPSWRDVDPGSGLRVHAWTLHLRGRGPAIRGQPLPRLARSGAVLQGRRTDLARGPRRREGAQGCRLRPQGVPPLGAGPRLDRPRSPQRGSRPAVIPKLADQ